MSELSMAPVHIWERDERISDGKEIEPRSKEKSMEIQFIKTH